MSFLDCCFRTARWFPVVFIVAVVGWSYYAYVVELLIRTIPEENIAEKVILGIIYHPVLFMFLWAYYKIVYTDPKSPPHQFYLDTEQIRLLREAEMSDDRAKGSRLLEQYVQSLPVLTRTHTQGVRYCDICRCIKPDRAHHCSVCKMCVLKMDHHCPWVNNCVSFINYKFFILFLLYAEIYCLYIALSDSKYFVEMWSGMAASGRSMNFHVLFLFIVAIMFSLSVLGLLGYHLYLVCKNQSTLESFRPSIFVNTGPDKNGFNIGRDQNWREVFGDEARLWFLPFVTCKGDGVTYPTRFNVVANHGYNSMENGQAIPTHDW